LIIDEAQNLSFELLEEIRLLSNMESADEKVITIFLVGQPELEEKLAEQRCFSLLQRITHRYQIPPLDLAGTEGYIASRLLAVGAPDPDGLFPENAVEAIHCYSRGYPRLINALADNALRLGWEKGEKQITVPMVKESFEQTAVGRAAVKSGRRWKAPRATTQREHLQLIHSWRWAALVCVFIGLLAFGMSRDGRKIVGQLLGPDPMGHYMPSENASFGKITVRIKDSRESEPQHLKAYLKEGLSAAIRHALKETQTGMLERSKDMGHSLQGNQNQPSSALTVEGGVICRGVTYGRPLLAGESFPASVGTLYCFTKIVGAQSPTQITHVWYFGDTMKSRAELKVKSASWRTYRARTIKAHEVGEWRVAVLGPGGEVLKTLGFKITP
jgi:hypothetical protein